MSRRGLDVALAIVLFALALALRWPSFMTIPAFTDEGSEVLWAVDAFRHGLWPLTSVDAYDGPLFPYLLRAWFQVVGLSPEAPRALVLLLGSLTVVVVYFLARELAGGDRRVGLLAAVLLCANAPHILINSHVAWSNCTTPLFTSLALLAYLVATRRGQPLLLPLAGVLYGLALQTHPYVIALAPALVLDVILFRSRRALLRSRAAYLSAFLAIVTYSPVIVHHLLTRGSDLGIAEQRDYTFETNPTLAKTSRNIGPTLVMTARVALGSLEPLPVAEPLREPAVLACDMLLALALIMAAQRGEPLPLLAAATTLVFFAVFNHGYRVPWSMRYSQPLMPMLLAAFGQLVIRLWDTANGRGSLLARIALSSLVATLPACSLQGLRHYYDQQSPVGNTNRALLDALELLRRDPHASVLLLGPIRGYRASSSTIVTRLHYVLALEGRDVAVVAPRADLAAVLRARSRASKRGYLVAPLNTVSSLPAELALRRVLELDPGRKQESAPGLFGWGDGLDPAHVR